MPFTGFINPAQLAMLTAALDAYCQMAGIQKGTHKHEQASLLILSMYRRGANTAKALTVAVENSFRGKTPLEND